MLMFDVDVDDVDDVDNVDEVDVDVDVDDVDVNIDVDINVDVVFEDVDVENNLFLIKFFDDDVDVVGQSPPKERILGGEAPLR